MIIYNKTWLNNLQVRKRAILWLNRELITEEEKQKVFEAKPVGFYMPGFWMALGLFFFTTILIFASSGFVSLLVASTGASEEVVFQFFMLIFSGTCLIFAEKYKKEKHYFHAGTDNALLWAGLGALIGNVFWILLESGLHDEPVVIVGCLLATGICSIATLRYADAFVALCGFAFGLTALFFIFGQLGTMGKAVIPFAGFGYSFGIYYYIKKRISEEGKVFYKDCLSIVEIAALLCAYLSVNYYVVRELSVEMFDLDLTDGQDIPFGLFFTFLTIAVPPGYIYLALKNKNRIMLRIGLLLIAASIFTIRYYHSVLPIETALIVGGAILIGSSYFLIRWLNVPQFGFSIKEEKEEEGLLKAESLIVAQTFAPAAVPSDTNQFGGGGFGGGGANDTY